MYYVNVRTSKPYGKTGEVEDSIVPKDYDLKERLHKAYKEASTANKEQAGTLINELVKQAEYAATIGKESLTFTVMLATINNATLEHVVNYFKERGLSLEYKVEHISPITDKGNTGKWLFFLNGWDK